MTIQKFLYLGFLTNLLIGCSSLSPKNSTSFDPSRVSHMYFGYEHNEIFSNSSLSKPKIIEQVVNNLQQWGYPISSEKNDSNSHRLFISTGSIKRRSTPAGFTFSIGDSDPRSLDFQKADTLPITCQVSAIDSPEQSAELTLVVPAEDYHSPNHVEDIFAIIVDDMSTACYNLLSQLNVKTQAQKPSSHPSTKSWIPEIRVETETETETVTDTTDTTGTTIAKPVSQSTETNNPISIEQTNDITPKEPNKSLKKPARKRYIIHNQGSPVIFKFGHDRQ